MKNKNKEIPNFFGNKIPLAPLFKTKTEPRKFYIIYYVDPITRENQFYFADTFEMACNRAESILRGWSRDIPVTIKIFEEVLTYIKQERDVVEDSKITW